MYFWPSGRLFLSTLSLRRATSCMILTQRCCVYFYPRSPCGERPGKVNVVEPGLAFLSTLSLRRATMMDFLLPPTSVDFYPRSPCGERPMMLSMVVILTSFLSTLSLRRATAKVHKTVGHFCAYETNFMEIASSC